MTDADLNGSQAAPVPTGDRRKLARDLRKSRIRQRMAAAMMVLPLALAVVLFFALPIASLLTGAVLSPEFSDGFPRSAQVFTTTGTFGEDFYAALYDDLLAADQQQSVGPAARRLNQDVAGFTTMVKKTVRAARRERPAPGSYRDWFAAQDGGWVDPAHQAAIARAIPQLTGFFLMSALDLRQDAGGGVGLLPPNERIFVPILLRTLTISLTVTLICCLVGYPLAWSLVHAGSRWRGVMMTGILFPFWTSLLVRTAAWIIVLQREGPVNRLLDRLGLIDAPLTLVFNRFGVIVALTHVLLPFLVLPLYSVMQSIRPDYMRAAKSLGARPARAFLTVYVPQTLPGLSAGATLVFIMAIGYYITPALVGGPGDQMISYFIAFYTNNTINWGLASALALNLLAVTLVLYALYQRLNRQAGLHAGGH